ncbi:MAG: prephenate dehydrogenase [Candidatus Nanopelagicales bacterium]
MIAAVPDAPLRVHVIGAGLIGASIGLALRRRGHDVSLADRDRAAQMLAIALGAGEPQAADAAPADLVVVAVPPVAVPDVAQRALAVEPRSTVMDIASIKAAPLSDLASRGADLTRMVGSHPVAGRERSGPGAARADLFVGRPWVLCPTTMTSSAALALARRVVVDCGAAPVEMSAEEHDQAVALVSHLPQIAASLTARRLLDAPESFLRLAGTGLRDTTRVAASDPALWVQILQGNAPALRALVQPLIDDLISLQSMLDDAALARTTAADAMTALLSDGRRGRARLPGKHGSPHATYATVPVVIADRPGELARLLVAAGDAGVNVEDISIEHSPGQPVGLVELAVAPTAVDRLATALRAGGWDVHAEESRLAD